MSEQSLTTPQVTYMHYTAVNEENFFEQLDTYLSDIDFTSLDTSQKILLLAAITEINRELEPAPLPAIVASYKSFCGQFQVQPRDENWMRDSLEQISELGIIETVLPDSEMPLVTGEDKLLDLLNTHGELVLYEIMELVNRAGIAEVFTARYFLSHNGQEWVVGRDEGNKLIFDARKMPGLSFREIPGGFILDIPSREDYFIIKDRERNGSVCGLHAVEEECYGEDDSPVALAQYCLVAIEVESLEDIEWNDYCMKHQKYLFSEEGLQELKLRIERGDFHYCGKCKYPLIPMGRRNKPYMDPLLLCCPKCDRIRKKIESIDGATYGPWININLPYPEWLHDLQKTSNSR